jgi:DNA polymerase-3 subunit delta
MKLTYQQLPLHLKNSLLPVYLLSGDEYLLIQESRDLIRNKAKTEGFSEIQRFEAHSDFSWNTLIEATNSLSLFSEKIYIEIKLIQKPPAPAAKLLAHFISNLSPTQIVVILSDKLDISTQKAYWIELIQKIGAHIQIWPFDSLKLKEWVEKHLKKHNLSCDKDVIRFLIHQTEGNLLACTQEIEKLALLFSDSISLDQITNLIADNARFTVFNLTDAILETNPKRVRRILSRLREQAIEPILILWALVREVRLLVTIKLELKNKSSWSLIFKKHLIWGKKQSLIQKITPQLPIEHLHQLLLLGADIDLVIKGILPGNIWDKLELLALGMCGIKL